MGILLVQKVKNTITRFLFGYVTVISIDTRDTKEQEDVFVDITCTPTHQYYLSNDGESWYTSHNCDDIVSEQTAKSKSAMEAIYDWWPGGFESRLLEGGRIIYIATRWSKIDPAEWLLERAAKDDTLDQWVVISIPAILDSESAKLLCLPEGESYWPEVWKTETLLKKQKGMPPSQWLSLYMQKPIASDGNIFKESMFRYIHRDDLNSYGIKDIIVTADTAFSTKSTADSSVIAIWGTFDLLEEEDSQGCRFRKTNVVLLDLRKGRWEYPDLVKQVAKVKEEWDPDSFIVEKKASGQSLIQDMYRRGYFPIEYTPDKDKVTRAHACTPFLEDKRVWLVKEDWNREFINELLSFPAGAHDDCVDVLTMLILWLRDNYTLNYEEEPTLEELEDEAMESGAYNQHYYW